MSDPVIIAVIGLINTALVGALAWHQTILAKNVQKIETATNSMKDALVKATGDQKLLEGMNLERARAKAESASNTAAVVEDHKTKEP